MRDPGFADQHVCEGTWFVGLDAIANDAAGTVGGAALAGEAVDWIAARFGPLPPLHRAQASAVYPGYPRPRAGEGAAAFGYRRNRDAAHVDGILPCGPDRRRHIREPHAWILGLPLTEADPAVAPLVVWEGSHLAMRDALRAALLGHPVGTWPDVDVTDPYQAARREVFARCPRVPVHVPVGGAVLLHPLLLHGVGPWSAPAAPPRIIAYFRPPMPGGIARWLAA
jgi:hypothetical protein